MENLVSKPIYNNEILIWKQLVLRLKTYLGKLRSIILNKRPQNRADAYSFSVI